MRLEKCTNLNWTNQKSVQTRSLTQFLRLCQVNSSQFDPIDVSPPSSSLLPSPPHDSTMLARSIQRTTPLLRATPALRLSSPLLAPIFRRSPQRNSPTSYQSIRALQTSADASTLVNDTLPSSSTELFQIRLHAEHFSVHNCPTPELVLDVSKDSLVALYRNMVRMRRMEMAAGT